MMNVAIVAPVLAGHTYRGTGTYTENLYKGLRGSEKVNVTLVSQKDNLSSFDIIHYPYFDPFFLTLPLLKERPTVVTVHDLIPLVYPHHFPKGIKGYIKWQIQRYSLGMAKAIITDSFASKKDILEFSGIQSSKIHPIPLGVGSQFKVITSRDILEKTRKKLKLPQNFILYVGDINYNKNVLGLLEAFRFVRESRPDFHLVLAGIGFMTPSIPLDKILELLNIHDLRTKVHRVGLVEKEDLVSLYNLAKIYVQPSFAEGFGLPVLEAMACGCPVITSNTSSLPEIAGDAGIFFNPSETQTLAQEIISLSNNPGKQEIVRKKGLEQVKQFTWEKSCDEVIKVYQSVSS